MGGLFGMALILVACSDPPPDPGILPSMGAGTGINEGDSCRQVSLISFDPPLGGAATTYEVDLDVDLGDAPRKFEMPVTCSVATEVNVAPEPRCLEDHTPYEDVCCGEVLPPYLVIEDGGAEPPSAGRLLGIAWQNYTEADTARLTIRREGTVIFDDEVPLTTESCTDDFKTLDTQSATATIP